jgi:hypothetical protein
MAKRKEQGARTLCPLALSPLRLSTLERGDRAQPFDPAQGRLDEPFSAACYKS